jgi:hypothetical protein
MAVATRSVVRQRAGNRCKLLVAVEVLRGSPALHDGFRLKLYTLYVKTCGSDISDGRAQRIFQ